MNTNIVNDNIDTTCSMIVKKYRFIAGGTLAEAEEKANALAKEGFKLKSIQNDGKMETGDWYVVTMEKDEAIL